MTTRPEPRASSQRGRLVVVIPLVGALSACGVKFSETISNLPMPEDLRLRTGLVNSAAYQSNLGALAGHVIYLKKTGGQCPASVPQAYSGLDLSLATYVKNGEELKPSSTPTPRYESKLTKGAEAGGTLTVPVASIVTNLSENEAAEVVVSEVYVVVRDDQIDQPKLQQLVRTALGADDCDRFFIRGVALSSIINKKYQEISKNGSATGSAFSAKGKVYSTNSQFSQGFALAMDLVRVPFDPSAVGILTSSPGMRPPISLAVPDTGFPRRP